MVIPKQNYVMLTRLPLICTGCTRPERQIRNFLPLVLAMVRIQQLISIGFITSVK